MGQPAAGLNPPCQPLNVRRGNATLQPHANLQHALAVLISDLHTLTIIRYNIASVWLVKDASSIFSIDWQISTEIHKHTRSFVGGARRTACARGLWYWFDTSEHLRRANRGIHDRHADPFRGDRR